MKTKEFTQEEEQEIRRLCLLSYTGRELSGAEIEKMERYFKRNKALYVLITQEVRDAELKRLRNW